MYGTVFDKTRELASEIAIASVNSPSAFPESRDPDLFRGDFKGCLIGGIEWNVTKTGGTGTLDGKLQHSSDGTNWYDVGVSFTQVSATGNEFVEMAADQELLRYLRFVFTLGSTLAGTVTAKVHFAQVGARGRYAPPGFVTKPS